MMDGTIRVESMQEEGSRFYLELPQVTGSKKLKDTSAQQAPIISHSHANKQYTILYVEDDPSSLNLVHHILQKNYFVTDQIVTRQVKQSRY